MDANASTVLVALLVSVVAPTLLAVLTNWSHRKEKREDWKRQDEVAKQALEAASMLAENTARRDAKLQALQETADGTHTIVNNQRTVLLRLNAELRERIARENPDDAEAQQAALAAREEADKAEAAERRPQI